MARLVSARLLRSGSTRTTSGVLSIRMLLRERFPAHYRPHVTPFQASAGGSGQVRRDQDRRGGEWHLWRVILSKGTDGQAQGALGLGQEQQLRLLLGHGH